MKGSIIISCEHAGHEVPPKYKHLFKGKEDILTSHRGWDPGAHKIARELAARLNAPGFFCDTTRLLIETNRSLSHPQLFSEFSQTLSKAEKQELLDLIYLPYRQSVEESIHRASKPVLHFSIHSFTPVWNGVMRDVDVGLLFDPSRRSESKVCAELQYHLAKKLPSWKIKFNEPYFGIDDGFTTYLRTKFSDQEYAGVEIEVNQKYVLKNELLVVVDALLESLQSVKPPPPQSSV